MNLKELIDKEVLEQEEALFVIGEYIKARKGVDVQPFIETRFGNLNTAIQLKLMNSALLTAVCWFKSEGKL